MTVRGLEQFWVSQKREILIWRVGLMAVAGLLLGMITPYETSNISSTIGRYFYWVGCTVFPALISGFAGHSVFPLCVKHKANVWMCFLAFCTVLAVPTFVWVAAWEVTLKGLFVYDGSFVEYCAISLTNMDFTLLQYFSFYLRVWVITVMLVGAISLIADRMFNEEPISEGVGRPVSPFLERIPAELGRDLLCLSMEDHYVRAHTSEGDTLILMRMADAVKELEAYPGEQVHRSWWVAKEAILKIEKEQRKVSLLLKNNITVPVSHRRVKDLKEAGFLT